MKMPELTTRSDLLLRLADGGFLRLRYAVPGITVVDTIAAGSRANDVGPIGDVLRQLKLVSRHRTGGGGTFEEWIPRWVAEVCQYTYRRLNPTELATIARKLRPVLKACDGCEDTRYAVVAAARAGADLRFITEEICGCTWTTAHRA